jgi:hypothetical protein
MQIRNQSRPQASANAATPPSFSELSSDQKLTRAMLIAAAVSLVATMVIVMFIEWHGV